MEKITYDEAEELIRKNNFKSVYIYGVINKGVSKVYIIVENGDKKVYYIEE